MAKAKTRPGNGAGPAAPFSGPTGTFVYFLLKSDGSVLTSYGAGMATLDNLLAAGWTALREVALTGGGALLVLKR
jgi:hypothetical protein